MEVNTKKSKPIHIEVYHLGVKEENRVLLDRQCVPEKELKDFIKSLSPRAVGHDLIRIGHTDDGGYLVPDDIEGIEACFSPGYGGNSAFEEILATRYGVKIFIADRGKNISIKRFVRWMQGLIKRESNPSCSTSSSFDFENKFLGTKNNVNTIRLTDWLQKKWNLDSTGDLILQMDIEGAEIDVLMDTSSDVLRKFRIMIIEFHGMKIFDLSIFLKYKYLFDKILKDFCVAHIHPNTTSKRFFYKNIEIFAVMEFTFIRKDRILPDNRELVFPHKLDRPNFANCPDVILPEIWQNRNKTEHVK